MTDADLLDAGLAGTPLPERLLALAALASELAVALRAPRLSTAEREHILARAAAIAGHTAGQGRPGRRGRRSATLLVAAGAGGAAVLTLMAVVGVALLRRTHPHRPLTVLGRAA